MNVRTLILLLVLVLGAGVYFFFFYGKEGSSLSFNESNFSVEDTASVSKMTLTRVIQGEEKLRLSLEKKGGKWRVNEKFDAFEPRVQQTLDVLYKMKVREALTASAKQSGIKFFNALHTRLDIYQEGKLSKSILIGTQTKDAKGTVMMINGSNSPYVLEIPGLPGYLNVYFPMDLNIWRENLLFYATKEDILSFEIVFDSLPAKRNLRWVNVNDDPKLADGTSGSLKTSQYFSLFKGKVFGETFVGADYPDKLKKLKKQQPTFQIKVTYLDGTEREIYLFKRNNNPNNYFGYIKGKNELITVQTFVIDKFLKDKSYFLDGEIKASLR
ncbi:MAG: DUF4340 domain-containing protein [Bacteroidia bacterium]|nr:DUF4340 domain-containing protein [Bacteroidia bacterium]